MQKYIANTKLGIGEVKSEDEKFYTVYFEEIEEEKKVLKLNKTYSSIEEAEDELNNIEEKEYKGVTAKENFQINDAAMKMTESAFKSQRGSWMR